MLLHHMIASHDTCVDCRYFLSFVFLGDARRLELSPCNTSYDSVARDLNVIVDADAGVPPARPPPLSALKPPLPGIDLPHS